MSDQAIPTPKENGKYAEEIARNSPEAMGLVFAHLDASSRQYERIFDDQIKDLKEKRDYWQERCFEAEATLARARMNLLAMFD